MNENKEGIKKKMNENMEEIQNSINELKTILLNVDPRESWT